MRKIYISVLKCYSGQSLRRQTPASNTSCVSSIAMRSQSEYTTKLDRLRTTPRTLPTSLSCSLAVYNFCDWTPDSDSLELYGAECSALNAHLETIFGLRAVVLITFLERGPGIESLVNLLARYLEGNYSEKPVLYKWLNDCVARAAATAAPES